MPSTTYAVVLKMVSVQLIKCITDNVIIIEKSIYFEGKRSILALSLSKDIVAHVVDAGQGHHVHQSTKNKV